jgi:hypothetical protein
MKAASLVPEEWSSTSQNPELTIKLMAETFYANERISKLMSRKN